MLEPSGVVTVKHDPHGPVSVVGAINVDVVRGALGSSSWIEPCSSRAGLALVVTDRPDLVESMSAAGVPAVLVAPEANRMEGAVTHEALGAWLEAFDDGALITPAEAESRAWLQAVRSEEIAEQARAREVQVEELRKAEAAEQATRSQLDRMAAHIDAIEDSTSWKITRRLAKVKQAVARVIRRSA